MASALSWLDVAFENLGLAMWPGIGVAFALAVYLDRLWGVEPRPARSNCRRRSPGRV